MQDSRLERSLTKLKLGVVRNRELLQNGHHPFPSSSAKEQDLLKLQTRRTIDRINVPSSHQRTFVHWLHVSYAASRFLRYPLTAVFGGPVGAGRGIQGRVRPWSKDQLVPSSACSPPHLTAASKFLQITRRSMPALTPYCKSTSFALSTCQAPADGAYIVGWEHGSRGQSPASPPHLLPA